MIKLNNVSKDYGNGRGVFNINLELTDGLVGFLGENGAGKTTTIKLLMGLLYPNEGEIFIKGKNLWDKNNYYLLKKYIGFLPDEDFLFPKLSGRENLEYASILKTDDKNWYKKLEEYLTDFGILDMLDYPFSSYSKGMKKKLQIIASIIGYPEILILDEPHKGLDVLSNIKMKVFLKKYVKDGNLVFFSSHILEMVEDICNEVIIIHKGKIVKKIKSLKNQNLTEMYLKSTE